ncbi:MAG: hemolysin III family protein [Syntrophales bacterium]
MSYTYVEEIANSITHGVGALMSVACLTLLVVFASFYGTASHVVGCTIFGSTMVLLYTASTLYHSLQIPRIKSIFKVIDHACVYLLIAGSYTPFALVTLKGGWGYTILIMIWALAVLCIVFKIFSTHRFKSVTLISYVFMGWLVVAAIKPLIEHLPVGGLILLMSGGMAYTLGLIFYTWKKLPYSHTVWHLFVLCGSICHFFAVLFYVIPLNV